MENQKMMELMLELVGEVKNLGNKIDSLENRFDGLENRFDGFEDRLGGFEDKLGGLENRFDNLENEVRSMKKDMNDRFDVVDMQMNVTQKMVIMNKDTNKRLSEQISANMESIENIKLSH